MKIKIGRNPNNLNPKHRYGLMSDYLQFDPNQIYDPKAVTAKGDRVIEALDEAPDKFYVRRQGLRRETAILIHEIQWYVKKYAKLAKKYSGTMTPSGIKHTKPMEDLLRESYEKYKD